MVEDLYELHLRGETLIIEHVGFERTTHEPDSWIRLEIHRIVGHEPEEWTLLCDGAGDHSDLNGPPGDDDQDCRLCRDHHIHTKALHTKLFAEARRAEQALEL